MVRILVLYCSLIITSRHFYPSAVLLYDGQCVSGGRWPCWTCLVRLSLSLPSLSRCLAALWPDLLAVCSLFINRPAPIVALLCVLLLSATLSNNDCQDAFARLSPFDCVLQQTAGLKRVVEYNPGRRSRLTCIVTREGHSCIMYTLLHLLLISTKRGGCPPPLLAPLILVSFASI